MIWLVVALLAVRSAHAVPLTVDVNLGAGPHWMQANGVLGDAAPGYLAASLDTYGVLDAKDLKTVRKRVPRKYRAMVPKKEARVNPYGFIPQQLIVSPGVAGGPAMYGASWTPITLSEDLIDGKRLNVDLALGATGTIAILPEDGVGERVTVFARPGLQARLEAELKLSRRFLLSAGYDGRVYLPQGLADEGFTKVAPGDDTLWYLGGAFAQLHYRFPKKIRY